MNRKWTPDTILAEAKKYQTRSEWKKNSGGSYTAAQERGLLSMATSHMSKILGNNQYQKMYGVSKWKIN
jgi:hypothetical protein